MATAALAITISADTGTVGACSVTYFSDISAARASSTSGVNANPNTNNISLSISAKYVYRNTFTLKSGSHDGYNSSNGSSCYLSYTAPNECEMVSVAATHKVTVNGEYAFFDSAASR